MLLYKLSFQKLEMTQATSVTDDVKSQHEQVSKFELCFSCIDVIL